MAKIRKIYDQTIKPDGSKLTIYPITSTRAVYTPESITMETLINEGYRFGGVIKHLTDSPEFTNQRVFYLADKVGVYPNFGNLTLAGGELGVFCYNKSQWIKGILKGGGTNLTGYQVVTSASLLPDEESTIGYIIGTDLYVWVGEGGDTKEGKYKNVGPFVGPQGNGIEQVFLSPTNYKLTIDFTNGTSWTSEQSIRGIAGAKGDKGDPGLTGAAGATGPKGNKGDKGDSGVSLGEVALTTDLDETEIGKALDASAMQTIPHWVDEEQEIEDVPSNYYTRTQTDQKLLNHKAEVNQYLTNQDNDIARLEDRIDNMVDGVDEFIHHRPTVINNGTIINAPDDEDLVATEENTLKFADRPAINAMGYVILRKNKTFSEQVTKTNTIYEIRYDFDISSDVSIPENCVLKFTGGSINGAYSITGNNTGIDAVRSKIFGQTVSIEGDWNIDGAYPEWFGVEDGVDATAVINKALDSFKKVVLAAHKTYIVNGTINLSGYRCLQLLHWTTLLKTANNTDPMVNIVGSYNSLLGDSKCSVIKSDYPSPYGIISICDYKDTVYNSATSYNKIDGIRVEGQISDTVQSIGLRYKHVYKSSGQIYPGYYNSFTNLYFLRFNVGIYLIGDANANMIRDIIFTYCGTGSFETDSGILMESAAWSSDEGVAACQENQITNVFVTGAYSSGAACLCLKGKVHNNIFIINGENGSGGYGIRVVGDNTLIDNNTFITRFVQFLGDSNIGDLYKKNILIFNKSVQAKSLIGETVTVSSVTSEKLNFTENVLFGDGYYHYNGNVGLVKENTKYDLFSFVHSPATYNTTVVKYTLNVSSSSYFNCVIDATIVAKGDQIIYYDVPVLFGATLGKVFFTNDNRIHVPLGLIQFGSGSLFGNAILNVEVFSKAGIIANKESEIVRPQGVDSDGYVLPYTSSYEIAHNGNSGATASRPFYTSVGEMYFDTTLGKPIWWSGTAWVDATGTEVS